MLNFSSRVQICTPMDNFRNFLTYFPVFPIIIRLIHRQQIGMAFGHLLFKTPRRKIDESETEYNMFDIENLMHLGVFNQLIPIWQVFFFIASLLPFLLWNRVKICLLITYMFTYYLGFMVQFGDYISSSGSMQPFVLYSLSGLAIAVFFVATIFTEQPEKTKVRWVRFSQQPDDDERPTRMRHSDPVEAAINVTNVSDTER
jgi:hypothetical protein